MKNKKKIVKICPLCKNKNGNHITSTDNTLYFCAYCCITYILKNKKLCDVMEIKQKNEDKDYRKIKMKLNILKMLIVSKILKKWNNTLPDFSITQHYPKYDKERHMLVGWSGYKIISGKLELNIPAYRIGKPDTDDFLNNIINELVDYWYNIPAEMIGKFDHKLIKKWRNKK